MFVDEKRFGEVIEKWRSDLNGAADIIEEYGWNQGYYGNEKYGYCIVGALMRAGHIERGSSVRNSEAYLRLSKKLKGRVNVEAYNDTVGRSKEEVLRALRDCANE